MKLSTQGLTFSALAWLVVLACGWLPPLDLQTQLLVLAPIIFLLGVPHGALDIVYARQLAGLQSAAAWGLFTAAYLAAAAAVVLAWWFAPGVFLVAFLLISALHFSGDLQGKTPAAFRVLYGCTVIVCPTLLHAAQVAQLFSLLAGASTAQALVAILQWAAWPVVMAIGVAAVVGAKQNMTRSVELVSVAALLSAAPPLVGFTIFFCAMHAARHVLRTRDYCDAGTLRHLIDIARWPMWATFAGVACGWWFSEGVPLDTRLMQLLFVGLAALTVPHMLLVEPVRFSGWAKGRGTKNAANLRTTPQ